MLAARLAAELNDRNNKVWSLTFGPTPDSRARRSTWHRRPRAGYRRKIDRHILPVIGHIRIHRVRAHYLETLYDQMLHPTDGQRPLAPKTMEVHLIIPCSLKDAVTLAW